MQEKDLEILIELEKKGHSALSAFSHTEPISANNLKAFVAEVISFYYDSENPNDVLLKPNPYLKCLLTNIISLETLKKNLNDSNFAEIYSHLTDLII